VTPEYLERGVVFDQGQHRLVGITTAPESHGDTGVLVLVGGPQYRVGSHRQFTLLARSLAEAGVPSLRFDFSGMGDSEGERRDFSDTLDDISAAIETFVQTVPGISRVVLWGLCDAASSAMMYAHRDSRVSGLILLNPWVHSGEYSPEVRLAQFYRPLLSSKDKWRYLVSGRSKIIPTLRAVGRDTLALLERRSSRTGYASSGKSFVREMLEGLRRFDKRVLVVLSEDDLTASEFSSLVTHDKEWGNVMARPTIVVKSVAGADHTFSKKAWAEEVAQLTIEWLQPGGAGQ